MVNEHNAPRWAMVALAVAVAAALLAVLAGLGTARSASAQSGETAMIVTGPTESVASGDDPVPFTISVENVENLAAFQFVLLYDPDVFEFSRAERTEFLSSTNREVVCPEPTVDAGSMRWSCVTLNTETPAGVDGSGAIATIFLDPTGSGSTDVTLDRVGLPKANIDASPHEDIAIRNTTIEVSGSSSFNWTLWGPVIGVVALVLLGGGAFAAMRMRDNKPASATRV